MVSNSRDPSGNFTFRDRLGKTFRLHLDKAEMGELQKKFADWREMAVSYHSPGAAYVWSISYGGTTMRVAESGPHIPTAFLAAKLR